MSRSCSYGIVLVVLGWYLMAPPAIRGSDGMMHWSANVSLRFWKNVASFDEAWECEKQLRARVADAYAYALSHAREEAARQRRSVKTSKNDMEEFADALVCVASDDPRLAK